MTSELKVHQALYGYDDGHRLLATSTDLASADQRLLLRQTDSPDAGRAGWRELLAGFGLPSGRFVWCMTWPAPEMPRPGCVWTHVLIIDASVVGQVPLFSPRETFRRPDIANPNLDEYRGSMSLRPASSSQLPEKKLSEILATAAWALFEPPTRPVRIGRVTLDEEPRHLMLMSLWAETWPELRLAMSLADAPQTVRELPGGQFDLQLQGAVRRSPGADERLIDGVLHREPPRWARALAEEAVHAGGLTDFLARYGPELPGKRESVVPLVRVWLALSDADAYGLVQEIQDAFPSPRRGGALKEALLGPNGSLSGSLTESALLSALVAEASPSALDLDNLKLEARVRSLLETDPRGVGVVLDAIPRHRTKAGSQVLDGLSAATSTSLERWLRADPASLPKLLRLRPEMASAPFVVKSLPPEELWEGIRRIRGSRQRVEIATAIVLGGGELDPEAVAASWKDSLAPIVESLADSGATLKQLNAWVAALTPSERRVLAHGGSAPTVLVISLIELSDPQDLEDWKPAVFGDAMEAGATTLAEAKVLLAALGHQDRPSWAPPAVSSYADLYKKSAAPKKLGAARGLLESLAADVLPGTEVRPRLAKALNRALKKGRWPETAALGVKDRDAFDALIDADDRAGLARKLLTGVLEEKAEAESWQVEALTRAAAERADPVWVAKQFARAVGGAVGKALGL